MKGHEDIIVKDSHDKNKGLRMLRQLGCGVVSLALIAPSAALALSVEDYELNSYLSQPLSLQIKLADLKGLSERDIRISLATPEEFAAAGIDFEPLHNSLSFDLNLVNDNSGVVQITTRQPVNEPFISFLVEYKWPSGRLMREYNLLLDPPSYRSASLPVSTPLAPATRAATSSSASAASAAPSASASVASQRSEARASGQEYKVTASDTLWNIAAKHRPDSSISVQQMMVVVQELNPDAFIDGNINLVKEGAVLRLPEAEDVRSIGTRDAMAEVALQNRQWQNRLKRSEDAVVQAAPKPLDGKGIAGAESAGAEASAVVDTGRVTLVTAEDSLSDSKESRAKGVDNTALNESISRLQRENSELADRLMDLEEQLNLSAELLTLRSQQIAQLEGKLKELNEEAAAELDNEFLAAVEQLEREQQEQKEVAELEKAAMAAEKAEHDALVSGDEAKAESKNEAASGLASEGMGSETEETREAGTAVDPAEELAEAAAVSEGTAEEKVSTAAKPVAPAVSPQPYEEPSFFESLFDNVLLLVGLFALLALALVLLVLRALRARKEKTEEEAQALAFGDDEDDAYDPFHLNEFDAPSVDELAAEAQALIESGQYDAAVSVLRNAINQEPSRVELRKTLLLALYQSNSSAYQQEVTAVKGTSPALDVYIAELEQGAGKSEELFESDISLDDLEDDLKLDVEPSVFALDEGESSEDVFDFDFDDAASETSDDGLELDLDDTLLTEVDTDSLDDFDFSFDEEEVPTNKIESALETLEDVEDFSFEVEGAEKLDKTLELEAEQSTDGEKVFLAEEEYSAADGAEDELSLELPTLEDNNADELSLGELDLEDATLDFSVEGGSLEGESLDDNAAFGAQVEFGELDLSELTEEELPLALESEEALDFDELSLVDTLAVEDAASMDLPELEVDEGLELDSFELSTNHKVEDLSDVDSLLAELDDFDAELDSEDLSSELERELRQINQEEAVIPVDNTVSAVVTAATKATTVTQAAEPKAEEGSASDLVDPEAESDPVDTQLNLARAFLDMGDEDIARETLGEVMAEGNDEQKALARAMLDELDA